MTLSSSDLTHLLFVCSRNRLRSPTAEIVFSKVPGIRTASAGLAPDAETPLDADLVEWAHEAIPRSLGEKGKTRTTGARIEQVLPHGPDVDMVEFGPRRVGAQMPAA